MNDIMNEEMKRIPTLEEMQEAVMGLNRDSATGLDDMTSAFSMKLEKSSKWMSTTW